MAWTKENHTRFAVGPENPYNRFFTGKSYLQELTKGDFKLFNVTFEPGCRNHWHIHHQAEQILICVGGTGYYQEWGKPAQKLQEGDIVEIPPEVKHWHGAAPDCWFSHVAMEVQKGESSNEWCEEVSDEEYEKAVKE